VRDGVERLDGQIVVSPGQRLGELRSLGEQAEEIVNLRPVATEHVLDSRHVDPRALGEGVAAVPQLLMEIARQEPPPQEVRGKCTNCPQSYGGIKPPCIAFEAKLCAAVDQFGGAGSDETLTQLWTSAYTFEKTGRPARGYRVDLDP